MKPPSFLKITHFTFATYMFTDSDCSRRSCPKYTAHKFCANCIQRTTTNEDAAYRNFTHILIKEIT